MHEVENHRNAIYACLKLFVSPFVSPSHCMSVIVCALEKVQAFSTCNFLLFLGPVCLSLCISSYLEANKTFKDDIH